MGKNKHSKLRACGRWMVWLCTVMLVILISISLWLRPGARVFHTSMSYANRGLLLDLSHGRFRILYAPGFPTQHSVQPKNTILIDGFDFEYWDRWPMAEKRSTVRWLSPVWWVSGRSIRGLEVSLVYPAAVGLIWSGLIWRRRPRFPAGHCTACGYSLDGLVSDVCPECGEKYA